MREFAFLPLLAIPLLVELTHHRFGIDAKGHLLHLDGLEELGRLSSRFFCCGLFFLALGFLGFFSLLLGGLGGRGCSLELCYLFFCC